MDRRDIIKRLLYPKCKTAIEFKFDTLIVNPLLSYITIQDIAQLNKIATSIKYSSKPKEKYMMIDQILNPRGFKKMASGTNRVTYRFLNDYRIVLKVAIDKVGLSDNGNEYRNQHLLKPFVTKCFEVSPCGTVGLFERVVPITSREEFINISEDVFDLINNLIGKYVLEDIGEKYYMNYGLREGFGPVLLDYPYVFELDGRKLICNAPEPLDPQGYCRGEIDYDVGFNNLICTKCGKRYLATELKSEDKSNKPKIIVKGEDISMRCVLKRGDEVVAKLNSESPVETKTIRPRKEFNNLKTVLTREEEPEENYKPNIRTKDTVDFKVKLTGRSRSNKNIDEEARKKEEALEAKSEKIEVKYEPPVEEVTVKHEFDLGVYFTRDEEKPVSNIVDTVSEEVTPTEPDVVENPENDSLMEDVKKYLEEPTSEAVDKCTDYSVFRATILVTGDILNLDTNEIVGYICNDSEECESEEVNEEDSNEMTEEEMDEMFDQIRKETDTVPCEMNDGDPIESEEEPDNSNISANYVETKEVIQEVLNKMKDEPYYSDSSVGENVSNDNVDSYDSEAETSVYKDKEETSGFTIGDRLGDKLKQFNTNTNKNYQTKKITSPVESQYSASNISKKNEEIKKEVPKLVIHPRAEIPEDSEPNMDLY